MLKTKYHTKTKYCKKRCDHNNKMIIIMEAHGSLVKKITTGKMQKKGLSICSQGCIF